MVRNAFLCLLCRLQVMLTRAVSDESTLPHSRRFLIQVEPTLQSLQSQEDTDGNMQITIEDNGPKVGWELKHVACSHPTGLLTAAGLDSAHCFIQWT